MEHIKIGRMPRIGKKPLSAFDLSHMVSKLEFESPVLRVVKGRVVCQMRPDKAKKAVLRVLCDCYPNVWPSVPEIARRCGYSVRHVGRILRELEIKDRLIVDVNSRLIWTNGKLVGCDDEGKKGGSAKDTPQYLICDRKIYDIFQQQQEFKRPDKANKRQAKPLTSQEKSEPNSDSQPLTSQEATPDISASNPRHLSGQPLTSQHPTPDTMADEPVMSCNQSLEPIMVEPVIDNQALEQKVAIQDRESEKQHQPQNHNPSFLPDMTRPQNHNSFFAQDMTMTVSEKFSGMEDEPPETVIRAVTDGEFNVGILNSYDSPMELCSACLEAIQEMSHQPFLGKITCSEIMDKAMGILWAQGIKAPGGWLPVLKELRATRGPATARMYPKSSTSDDLTGIDALMADRLNRVDDPDDIPF